MGRDLQKKKRRSGRAPTRQSNSTKKILNPRGNSIIAKNWDKKETLSQNYRRLGLLARLKAPTGGTEKTLKQTSSTSFLPNSSSSSSSLAGASSSTAFAIPTTDKAILSEAKVERDADGNIVRILSVTANPLRDALNALDSDDDGAHDEDANDEDEELGHADGEEEGTGRAGEEAARQKQKKQKSQDVEYEEWGGIREAGDETDVVKSLMREARSAAPARARHQSEQEREWLERLVGRHGEDYGAMARDGRLNPMQQTGADLKRRIKKMRAEESST